MVMKLKLNLKCIGRDDILTLDTDEDTCGKLRQYIANKYEFSPTLLMVYRGRVLKNEEPIGCIDDDSTVIIAKWRVQVQAQAQAPEPDNAAPVQEPVQVQEPEPVCVRDPEPVKIYTGEQVKQAIKFSGNIMFNLLHSVAKINPYTLAYLATNPDKAREEIIKYVSDPAFSLKIIGEDPIAQMQVVDERNILYIIRLTGASEERARERYYALNKDITQTLDSLLLERVNV